MAHWVIWISQFVDDDGLPMGPYKLNPEDDSVFSLPWLKGIPFGAHDPGLITMRIESDDVEAGFFGDYVPGGVPLMSDRLRQSMRAAGVDNIQYFQVSVANEGNYNEVPVYWAFNIVGRVAVADPARSHGTKAFGQHGATLFDEFRPDPELEQLPPCVRSLESASTIVVSDAVVAACATAGIDTLDFIPPEVWFS